ncbi:MAG: sigma-E factor negative regulatory protein [Gammaproteobacteria bacterium]|nr:sigma-E factor negative regulatory protein [Gammaproteobacteria bacterium]
MQISAFVDGELPDNEADLLLRRMGQDAELRQRVAEYFAIGRVMRDEVSWPGIDRIHERVAAAIDDKPIAPQQETSPEPTHRSIRPLASVAAAAAVAVIAIFGLQQMTGVDGTIPAEPTTAPLPVAADASYTVPQPIDEKLREYFLVHGASATENGASGMMTRFVSLRLSDGEIPTPAEDDAESSTTEDGDGSPNRP